MFYENLSVMDREVTEALLQELNRQNDNIELIASENFVPESIMEAMGSAFTNKYADLRSAACGLRRISYWF